MAKEKLDMFYVGGMIICILFTLLSILAIIFGIHIYSSDDEGVGVLMLGVGILGTPLFGIGSIAIIRNLFGKNDNTVDVYQWSSGTLTHKMIRNNLLGQLKTNVLAGLGTTVIVAFFCVFILCYTEVSIVEIIIFALSPLVPLGFVLKSIIVTTSNASYYIQEDKVISGKTKTTFDVVDAVTTHLPTQTAVLNFEKHGEYKINSMHIHPYYPPEALAEIIEAGEEVYMVYSKKNRRGLTYIPKKILDLGRINLIYKEKL